MHVGHVGIDASRLSTRARTGTERYTYELVGGLSRIDRQTRWTLYSNGLPAMLPPLGPHVALRSLPFPRLWTHLRLGWEMLRHPPDVLFVPAHVIPALHPPRSVVTVHDLGYLHFPEAHTLARRLDLHLSTRWSVRAAWRIIAVSQATKDDLVQHYRVPPSNITVVHHGLSSEHFSPVTDPATRAACTARYGISGDYFLYVGTIQPRKNLLRLIEAFAQVLREERGSPSSTATATARPRRLSLVLAGKKGWLTAAIEQRVAELDIKDNVQFIGYVDDDALPALMSGARAFVFPSLYEGFGMPVLEAMACGTPVLTSTTSSLPEVAGDAALLVDPTSTRALADGLSRLLHDTALCDTLRERGRARASGFTWERCAQETRRVLCE